MKMVQIIFYEKTSYFLNVMLYNGWLWNNRISTSYFLKWFPITRLWISRSYFIWLLKCGVGKLISLKGLSIRHFSYHIFMIRGFSNFLELFDRSYHLRTVVGHLTAANPATIWVLSRTVNRWWWCMPILFYAFV